MHNDIVNNIKRGAVAGKAWGVRANDDNGKKDLADEGSG